MPQRKIPISVEDVIGYFKLAREQAGLQSEDKMLDVFQALTNQVSTIALGNVQRVYGEIRSLVESLLSLHMISDDEKVKIPNIVKTLTEQYTHDYPICRMEAEKIGLKIKKPDEELESSMMNLFKEYESDLNLQEPFNPDGFLVGEESRNFRFETAYIESTVMRHIFIQEGMVRRQTITAPPPSTIPGVQLPSFRPVMITFTSQKWETIR